MRAFYLAGRSFGQGICAILVDDQGLACLKFDELLLVGCGQREQTLIVHIIGLGRVDREWLLVELLVAHSLLLGDHKFLEQYIARIFFNQDIVDLLCLAGCRRNLLVD